MAPEALKTRTATPKIMASRLTKKRIAGERNSPPVTCTLPVPK